MIVYFFVFAFAMLRIRNTFWLKTVKLKISHGFEYKHACWDKISWTEWRHAERPSRWALVQNGGCRCWTFGLLWRLISRVACALEAETSVSNLTQYKLFIGDDKKNTLFGVTFSFKQLRRQRRGKRHLKINICAVATFLRLFHILCILQCWRSTLKLDWYARRWIKYKELKTQSCMLNLSS